MEIGSIEGATRILGRGQEDYKGLPVLDQKYGDGRSSMTSAWFPSMEELHKLVNGAPIYLMVMGEQHPPVSITVGPVPEL